MKKEIHTALAFLLAAGLFGGCAAENVDVATSTSQAETTQEATTSVPETTTVSETESETAEHNSEAEWEETDAAVIYSHASGFYDKTIIVNIKSQDGGGIIRFTTDGSEPTEASEAFTTGITLLSSDGDFPNCYCIRAKIFYDDGTQSQESAHTYFVDKGIENRFTTYVFSLWGSYDDIYASPDGLLLPANKNDRGIESEREVYLSAFDSSGNELLGQFCGARVYGGASRDSSVKSLKLFARKSYDPDNGSFKFNIFGTENYEGEVIDKYKKLVLRNAGNDFQFSYIRDELNQTLAMQAGYSDYEGVVPVVGYVNGNYYCLYWLHESYCDELFKQKYGKADGEFVVVQGNDEWKYDDYMAEDEKASYDEYNNFYSEYKEKDLTDDKVYEALGQIIDISNYLDYFAFNIYVCNKDWPNNNYKCYRYYAAENEEYGEGVFDGRWRYLLHDIDYTYGMYEQYDVMANYNNLKNILNPKSKKYAPLFSKLMEREDCKQYFASKICELMNGALSYKNIYKTLDEMSQSRESEMTYYYRYLEGLRNKGDESIWTRSSHLEGYLDQIRSFATSRPQYMIKNIETCLGIKIAQTDGNYVIDNNN